MSGVAALSVAEAGALCSGARAACNERAVYVIVYHDHDGTPFPVCAECSAVLRANDPLEYIASVRSLERSR